MQAASKARYQTMQTVKHHA